MKTIDTLIPDIHALFEGHTLCEENMGVFQEAMKYSFNRQFTREDKRTLRLSSIGKPDRQQWYEMNGAKKEPTQPSAKIKFTYGDILESMLLFLAVEAGHTVENIQEEIIVEGIKGHIDAVIDNCLVDIKSASVRSFDKFRQGKLVEIGMFGPVVGDDTFGYCFQLGAYNTALKKDRLGWLAIEKEKGHLALPMYTPEQFPVTPEVVKKRINHVKVMIDGKIPARCYPAVPDGKSGNLTLSVGCSYCPFKNECWADSNGGAGIRYFAYSNGIKPLVHVERLPEVQEIIRK